MILEAQRVLPPPRHPAEHWERLADEVARMVAEVPLYRGRPALPPGADPEALAHGLAALPTVGKPELRRGFPRSLVRSSCDFKAALDAGAVEILATSGTTENRLQVLWEASWWDPQEREAMRLCAGVAAAMARPGFREAVLCTPVCSGAACHIGKLSREERTVDGMLFLNQLPDPTHWSPAELDRMIGEWNELAPDGVEADPAYLAALCRHAVQSGQALHAPAYLTLTYEQITRGHRRAIAAALPAPAYSLYGATEAGVLFMECAEGRLHHNARHSHIELLDCGGGLARVVVTTLGRTWMPLLRYQVGDLVRVAASGACACGRPEDGYLLERVEGRAADAIALDGCIVSPALLDDAVDAAEPEVEAWQLARAASGWTLHVVGTAGERAARAVAELLAAAVRAQREAALPAEASGKYRLVRGAA